MKVFGCGLNSSGDRVQKKAVLGQGKNDASGSIKGEEFLEYLGEYLQEGVCSLQVLTSKSTP
jgi:hypothetical protein